MFKTNIKTLFREILSIPLESADPDLLAHISFWVQEFVDPGIHHAVGHRDTRGRGSSPGTCSTNDGGVRLAGKELDKDMTPEDRARCIVYLLHTPIFSLQPGSHGNCRKCRDKAINNVDLAQKATATTAKVAPSAPTAATPATEPHQYLHWPYLCKILCYDFIISARKRFPQESGTPPHKMGIKNCSKNGSWLENVTEDIALQRLEAYALYSDVADQHKYEKTIRKAIQYYSELPQITRRSPFPVPSGTMGKFGNYPEQVEQIMNNVLDGKLSATATGSISDKTRNAQPTAQGPPFHILALYRLTEQE